MKKLELSRDQSTLLNHLSHLPRKIVSLKGMSNAPEFVLHELCDERCFNLSKAAFFIDNPDFNFIKGVAGFQSQEAYPADDIWQNPEQFIAHMQQAPFNQMVRGFSHESVKRTGKQQDMVEIISRAFEFEQPAYRVWDMKHDNHGFLVYEYNGKELEGIEEHLDNSLYLLNFCPLF